MAQELSWARRRVAETGLNILSNRHNEKVLRNGHGIFFCDQQIPFQRLNVVDALNYSPRRKQRLKRFDREIVETHDQRTRVRFDSEGPRQPAQLFWLSLVLRNSLRRAGFALP